jgi:hypothetical protein
MTVSQMHFMKTETRDMADRVRASAGRLGTPIDDWRMSNATFLTAFVVIAGVIAMLALVLRLAA